MIEQLLNWLQRTHTTPGFDEFQNRVNALCRWLKTDPVSHETLMKQAKKSGYGNALNRLDALVNQ